MIGAEDADVAPAGRRQRRQTSIPWPVLGVFVGAGLLFSLPSLLGGKELIPWRTDLTAARDEAKRTHKPVFLYFTASWCGPCQNLKRTTWADRGVDAALRDYVPVEVDVDAHPDLAREYHVEAMPTFYVIDVEAGKVVKTIEGAMEPGEFIRWLKG